MKIRLGTLKGMIAEAATGTRDNNLEVLENDGPENSPLWEPILAKVKERVADPMWPLKVSVRYGSAQSPDGIVDATAAVYVEFQDVPEGHNVHVSASSSSLPRALSRLNTRLGPKLDQLVDTVGRMTFGQEHDDDFEPCERCGTMTNDLEEVGLEMLCPTCADKRHEELGHRD